MALNSELLVRNEAEDLKISWWVLEQWIFLPASREELGLCMVEESIQAFVFDPSTVLYWFIFLVFFVHQEGDHSDKYGQAANKDQDTIYHSRRGAWASARDRDEGAREGQTHIITQSEVHTVCPGSVEGPSHSQQAHITHIHRVAECALSDLAGGVRNYSADLFGNDPLAGHDKIHQGVVRLWRGNLNVRHLNDVNLQNSIYNCNSGFKVTVSVNLAVFIKSFPQLQGVVTSR